MRCAPARTGSIGFQKASYAALLAALLAALVARDIPDAAACSSGVGLDGDATGFGNDGAKACDGCGFELLCVAENDEAGGIATWA